MESEIRTPPKSQPRINTNEHESNDGSMGRTELNAQTQRTRSDAERIADGGWRIVPLWLVLAAESVGNPPKTQNIRRKFIFEKKRLTPIVEPYSLHIAFAFPLGQLVVEWVVWGREVRLCGFYEEFALKKSRGSILHRGAVFNGRRNVCQSRAAILHQFDIEYQSNGSDTLSKSE